MVIQLSESKRNQKLEIVHRTLDEELDIINLNRIPELIESLKVIAKDLGDAIYLPDFNRVEEMPPESYSCLGCGSTNLRTILIHEVSDVGEFPINPGPVYVKTCKACGHIYHVDEKGEECIIE